MKKNIKIGGIVVVIAIGITTGFLVVPMLTSPPTQTDGREPSWPWPTYGWIISTPASIHSFITFSNNGFIAGKDLTVTRRHFFPYRAATFPISFKRPHPYLILVGKLKLKFFITSHLIFIIIK